MQRALDMVRKGPPYWVFLAGEICQAVVLEPEPPVRTHRVLAVVDEERVLVGFWLAGRMAGRRVSGMGLPRYQRAALLGLRRAARRLVPRDQVQGTGDQVCRRRAAAGSGCRFALTGSKAGLCCGRPVAGKAGGLGYCKGHLAMVLRDQAQGTGDQVWGRR